MKLLAQIVSSVVAAGVSESFDDGAPSLLQLRAQQHLSPALADAASQHQAIDDRATCMVQNTCSPCSICSAATRADLSNIVQNNLGGLGTGPGSDTSGSQEIRYKNAIDLNGQSVDVVLVATGDYTTQVNKRGAIPNGNNGQGFGRVSVGTGTLADFQFLFQDATTGDAVSIPDIALTFYDLDEADEVIRVGETISACEAQEVYITSNTELGYERVDMENMGTCHRVTSSVAGNGQDNPKTATELTMAQADRSVTYEFHGRSSINWRAQVSGRPGSHGRPMLFSFEPQVACGASDSEATCRECRATIETSSQGHADTATGAQIQFRVHGEWSQSYAVGPNIASDEAVTVSGQFDGNPDAIKIIAGGSNAWGYRSIVLSYPDNGQMLTFQLLNSENGEDYGANWYWVDGDQEAPDEQIYETLRECRASIETSSQGYADTATGAQIQFRVNGGWSQQYSVGPNIAKDEVVTASGQFHGDADAIRVTAGGTNAWGYRRIELNCDDRITQLLDSANGQSYGNNQYWVDADQDAPSQQVYEA